MDEVHQTNLGDFSPEKHPVENGVANLDSDTKPPREISMPSVKKSEISEEKIDYLYHDLGIMYPNPPIPTENQGVVIRRARLDSISGINNVLNWVAENSAVVVNLERIISRDVELNVSLDIFSTFVEEDMGGQILQLTKSKVLLLPPECKGISGIEDELMKQG